jgi:hypothetical protein
MPLRGSTYSRLGGLSVGPADRWVFNTDLSNFAIRFDTAIVDFRLSGQCQRVFAHPAQFSLQFSLATGMHSDYNLPSPDVFSCSIPPSDRDINSLSKSERNAEIFAAD